MKSFVGVRVHNQCMFASLLTMHKHENTFRTYDIYGNST